MTEYDYELVGPHCNDAAYTEDGLCKKVVQFISGSRHPVHSHKAQTIRLIGMNGHEHRLVSYYNAKDAQQCVLPRASEIPAYAELNLNQKLLDRVRYFKRNGGQVPLYGTLTCVE